MPVMMANATRCDAVREREYRGEGKRKAKGRVKAVDERERKKETLTHRIVSSCIERVREKPDQSMNEGSEGDS